MDNMGKRRYNTVICNVCGESVGATYLLYHTKRYHGAATRKDVVDSDVLNEIARRSSSSDLAVSLRVDLPTIEGALRKLEAQGLVKLYTFTSHITPRIYATLTDKGISVLGGSVVRWSPLGADGGVVSGE
ncbi:MAG: hypothetical protein QW453_06340 [Thermoprotei archaeon]